MQTFLNQHPIFFALGFLVYFVTLWLVVGVVIGTLGGWRSFAKDFRTTRSFPQNTMHMQSATMRGHIGYHSALTLGSDSDGLYLGVLFLFCLGSPRLFLPWSEIRIGSPAKQFLWTKQTLLLGPSEIPLTLRMNLSARLLAPRP